MGTAACVAWLDHAVLTCHPSVVCLRTFCLFRQETIRGHLSRVLSLSLHSLLPSGSLFHLGITYTLIHSFVCLLDLRFSAITSLFRSLPPFSFDAHSFLIIMSLVTIFLQP